MPRVLVLNKNHGHYPLLSSPNTSSERIVYLLTSSPVLIEINKKYVNVSRYRYRPIWSCVENLPYPSVPPCGGGEGGGDSFAISRREKFMNGKFTQVHHDELEIERERTFLLGLVRKNYMQRKPEIVISPKEFPHSCTVRGSETCFADGVNKDYNDRGKLTVTMRFLCSAGAVVSFVALFCFDAFLARFSKYFWCNKTVSWRSCW